MQDPLRAGRGDPVDGFGDGGLFQDALVLPEVVDRLGNFFVSAEQRQALRAKHEAEARELAQRRMEAERDLQAGGNPIPLREDLQEVYVRMGEDKREQLRQMLEKTRRR
mgnify:CR=1 FL=1